MDGWMVGGTRIEMVVVVPPWMDGWLVGGTRIEMVMGSSPFSGRG